MKNNLSTTTIAILTALGTSFVLILAVQTAALRSNEVFINNEDNYKESAYCDSSNASLEKEKLPELKIPKLTIKFNPANVVELHIKPTRSILSLTRRESLAEVSAREEREVNPLSPANDSYMVYTDLDHDLYEARIFMDGKTSLALLKVMQGSYKTRKKVLAKHELIIAIYNDYEAPYLLLVKKIR